MLADFREVACPIHEQIEKLTLLIAKL